MNLSVQLLFILRVHHGGELALAFIWDREGGGVEDQGGGFRKVTVQFVSSMKYPEQLRPRTNWDKRRKKYLQRKS